VGQSQPPPPPPTGQANTAISYTRGETSKYNFNCATIKLPSELPLVANAPVKTRAQQAAAISPSEVWLVDSGASQNLVSNRELFIKFHEYSPGDIPYRYKTAGGGIASAKGYSKVIVRLQYNGKITKRETFAYYNPDLDFHMLSTDKMGKDMKAYWCSKDLHIRDWSTDEIIGSSYDYHGVPRAIVMPSGTALAALMK
jgi:hypothetical protein